MMQRSVPLSPVFQESMQGYLDSRRIQPAASAALRDDDMRELRKRKQEEPLECSPKRSSLSDARFDDRRFRVYGDSDRYDEPTVSPLTLCGSRKYSDWVGNWDGRPSTIHGTGALFPEGYMPRIGEPRPWVCPIRGCNREFEVAWGLGGHFSAGHRGCLLNDNQDGTMSIVGTRTPHYNQIGTLGRIPPVVVSRDAANTASPPPTPVSSPHGRKKPPHQLWRYIARHFNTPKPNSPQVGELLRLADKRRRGITADLRNKLVDMIPTVKLFCALIVFLSGEEEQHACDYCVMADMKSAKSFPECVRLSPDASDALWQYFGGFRCCNAFYGPPRCVAIRAPAHTALHTPIADAGERQSSDLVDTNEDEEQPRAQSDISYTTEGDGSEEGEKCDYESFGSDDEDRPCGPVNENEEKDANWDEDVVDVIIGNASTTDKPTAEPEDAGPDWEIAPGRVTTPNNGGRGRSINSNLVTDDGKRETIAYSADYLRHSSIVLLAPEVSVRAIEISPRVTKIWDAELAFKNCSVVQGMVAVETAGMRFNLKKGGIWLVREGRNCVVANLSDEMAVVHVMTFEVSGDGVF